MGFKEYNQARKDFSDDLENNRINRNKDALVNSTSTKIRTSFIFALAEFERVFGHLWGHEIEDDDDLTDEQYQMYEMYMMVRKNILDNGNTQIRAMKNDLNGYSIGPRKTIIRKDRNG